MIILNVWDLPKYGFNRKVLEKYVYSDNPEYEWFKQSLVYRDGYNKPKIHLERFLSLYHEYRNSIIDAEIARLEAARIGIDNEIEEIITKYVEQTSIDREKCFSQYSAENSENEIGVTDDSSGSNSGFDLRAAA